MHLYCYCAVWFIEEMYLPPPHYKRTLEDLCFSPKITYS